MEIEDRYASGVAGKRGLVLVRGQGSTVWDEGGRPYLDCCSGHGVANIGHTNPAVTEAICHQANTLMIMSDIFHNDVRAKFLELLMSVVPAGLERAYLGNSGTEAVEAALKFARLSTGRTGIVATMRGFHGRTMGSLSATWEPHYREPFMPLVPGVSHVPYNNLEAMRQAVDDNTAAVLVEVVQGEGGVHPATTEYIQGLRELCTEKGALLIFDEVQTGFGRTGRLFACQHHDVTPDILCLAKAIAGGIPMGAAVFGPAVKNIRPGVHGTTFGGNPLACAAGLATINFIMENDLPAQAARKGAWAMERLRRIESPLIREVRGLGLIIGIDIKQRAVPYLRAMMDAGVLALPAGKSVIRLLPPLVISDDELAQVCDVVEKVLSEPLNTSYANADE